MRTATPTWMQLHTLLISTSLWIAVLPGAVTANGAEDRIVVERDEQLGTLTILVRTQQGLLDWNDVLRGLARAAELDEEAAVDDVYGPHLDLQQRHAWLTI